VAYRFVYTPVVGPVDTSTVIFGASEPIYFPSQTMAGTYKVYGYVIGDTTCRAYMNGSVSINLNPKPKIDSASVTCTGGTGSASLTVYTQPIAGSLVYSIDGISYQPTPVFTNLTNGVYNVYVRQSVTHCSDTLTGVIVFCDVPPVTTLDFICTLPGTMVAGNVMTNDHDPAGNAMKVTIQNIITSKGASFTIDTLGQFNYTPVAGFKGFDTITYAVCDVVPNPFTPKCTNGQLVVKTSPSGIFANQDTVSTLKNEIFTSVISILANDSTSDGDSIYVHTVSNVATSNGGIITINNSGMYTYNPPTDFTGTDTYLYTIQDRCGHTAQATISIRVYEIIKKTLFIPGGFSPNGDGVHDYFELGNTEGYTDIQIKIFNRWGSLIYENSDYKAPNWWDGNSNASMTIGNRLPDGTYFYEIVTNTGEKYVNYLTLKR
ncbi:MAG TPA: Ig-like domain-containing protein, partial [Cytophagaceae bacterium]|nr:Ig-like domain-containing protein [Cytophagaceae bacterium]